MNMTLNWSLYQRREETAQLGALLTGALIFMVMHSMSPQQDESVAEAQISLKIVSPPVAPEKITQHEIQPRQQVIPEKIVAQIAPIAEVPLQEKMAAPIPPSESVDTKPQPQHLSNSGAEGVFAQDVRSRIERKKVYPDTARDLGMEGEVEVRYELDRAGNLLHAAVVASSGYKLLDQAALKAVKSATYKSFPEDAWVGSGSKEFRTKLVFSINQ